MNEKLRKFNYDYNIYKNNLVFRKKCPSCYSINKKKLWVKVNKYFKAVECTICNFIYINKTLDEAGLESYYNNYIEFRLQNKIKLKQRNEMYKIDLKYLNLYKKSGKLIDIGCSNGNFLKFLVKNYQSFGIDVDGEAIKLAKKEPALKKRVFEISVDKVGKKLGKFDIVILRGVIEHVENPRDYFYHASMMLKKNGIIFISATPNVNSPCAIKFKNKWNQFDPIQHINIFSSKTLSKIANSYGFKLIGEHYPYLETPYANPVEDYKKFISPTTNISPPFWGSMMTLVFRKS